MGITEDVNYCIDCEVKLAGFDQNSHRQQVWGSRDNMYTTPEDTYPVLGDVENLEADPRDAALTGSCE